MSAKTFGESSRSLSPTRDQSGRPWCPKCRYYTIKDKGRDTYQNPRQLKHIYPSCSKRTGKGAQERRRAKYLANKKKNELIESNKNFMQELQNKLDMRTLLTTSQEKSILEGQSEGKFVDYKPGFLGTVPSPISDERSNTPPAHDFDMDDFCPTTPPPVKTEVTPAYDAECRRNAIIKANSSDFEKEVISSRFPLAGYGFVRKPAIMLDINSTVVKDRSLMRINDSKSSKTYPVGEFVHSLRSSLPVQHYANSPYSSAEVTLDDSLKTLGIPLSKRRSYFSQCQIASEQLASRHLNQYTQEAWISMISDSMMVSPLNFGLLSTNVRGTQRGVAKAVPSVINNKCSAIRYLGRGFHPPPEIAPPEHK